VLRLTEFDDWAQANPKNAVEPCFFNITVSVMGLLLVRCLTHKTPTGKSGMYSLCFERLWPRLDKFFAFLNTGRSLEVVRIDEALAEDRKPLRDASGAYA